MLKSATKTWESGHLSLELAALPRHHFFNASDNATSCCGPLGGLLEFDSGLLRTLAPESRFVAGFGDVRSVFGGDRDLSLHRDVVDKPHTDNVGIV